MSATDHSSIQPEPGAPTPAGTVPLCIPEIHGNEWVYLKECLDTNWVSSVGPFVDRFERELADYVGARYAVATCNGTAALHVALMVAGVQPDDEVLVSTLSFIAPANAARYLGAWPVLIDAEADYWQIDPQKVLTFLDKECRWRDEALRNRTTGRRVKALLPVHILGHPVDMDPILEAARRYELVVVEDATESLGARYKGEHTGRLGNVGCFSFNGNKIITTGGGGMIVTDDETWARRARYLTTQAKDDALEYIHHEIGYNYRLTNIQAAMGCAQLEQLESYVAAKRRIAAAYAQALADVPGITCPSEAPWAFGTFWLYTILVDEEKYGLDSRALLRALAAAGIQTRPLWQPLHHSRALSGCQSDGGAVADRLNRDGLSLPCSVGLGSEQQAYVVETIRGLHQGKG